MDHSPPNLSYEKFRSRNNTFKMTSEGYLPSEEAMKRKVNRYRKHQYVFKDPSTISDLRIPASFKYTLRGDTFLQYD
jgi:hypothetical protein